VGSICKGLHAGFKFSDLAVCKWLILGALACGKRPDDLEIWVLKK